MSNFLAGFATREQAKRAATLFFDIINNELGKEGRDFHLHRNERGHWHFASGAAPAQLRPATREEVMPSEDSNTTNARPDVGPGRECEPSGAEVPGDVRELVERIGRAMATASNDDFSDPGTEKRTRHVKRVVTLLQARCALLLVASDRDQERALRLAAEAEQDRLREERDGLDDHLRSAIATMEGVDAAIFHDPQQIDRAGEFRGALADGVAKARAALSAETKRNRLTEALAQVERRWSTAEDIRLRAGEISPQVMRTTKACLDAVFRELRAAAQPGLDKESDR